MVKLLFVVSLVLAAPLAAAGDPFRDPVCISSTSCFGPGTCSMAGCVPQSCEPALDCRGEVGNLGGCAVNMSIDGRTCQVALVLDAQRDGVVLADAASVDSSSALLSVTLTNGSVDEYNLENVWITPTAEAGLVVAGVDTGYSSIGVYRSDITTEGPRGGPFGMIAPSSEHTWTQISLVAGNSGGAGGTQDVQVSVWLLDMMLDGCHVRSPSGRGLEVTCPRVQELP